jgi:hypothetical protein
LAERAGDAGRPVAELTGGGEDALARLGSGAAATGEHATDRCGRNPGVSGDIGDVRRHASFRACHLDFGGCVELP